ncbi:DUF2975 domain-containing protein [Maricaulis maris]|uniref:DUF2975 domain-containing protein n=1 Tax=Maricaulis maris TaxID=74318 RepID=UPI003B8C7635
MSETSPDLTRSDRHIRRLSLSMMWAVTVLTGLLPILVWGMWLLPETSGIADQRSPGGGFGGGDLGWYVWPVRLGAAGLATIGLAISVYGLINLRTLFQETARGAYFSADAVVSFRQFALASLVGALWQPVEHTLLGVYLTVSNPHAPNALEISLGSGNLEAIGAALLFFVIAFILAEGRKRHEELELIL